MQHTPPQLVFASQVELELKKPGGQAGPAVKSDATARELLQVPLNVSPSMLTVHCASHGGGGLGGLGGGGLGGEGGLGGSSQASVQHAALSLPPETRL